MGFTPNNSKWGWEQQKPTFVPRHLTMANQWVDESALHMPATTSGCASSKAASTSKPSSTSASASRGSATEVWMATPYFCTSANISLTRHPEHRRRWRRVQQQPFCAVERPCSPSFQRPGCREGEPARCGSGDGLWYSCWRGKEATLYLSPWHGHATTVQGDEIV